MTLTVFKEMLNGGAEKFEPSKILKKQHRLPWVSNNIKRLIRQRDKAFSTMKDTQEKIDKFKDLKSTVQREIRKKLQQIHRRPNRTKFRQRKQKPLGHG